MPEGREVVEERGQGALRDLEEESVGEFVPRDEEDEQERRPERGLHERQAHPEEGSRRRRAVEQRRLLELRGHTAETRSQQEECDRQREQRVREAETEACR